MTASSFPTRRLAERIGRWPLARRAGLVALATAVLLWLTLSPTDALPRVSLWDKAEHAIGFAIMTGVCGLMFPTRRWTGAALVLVLGVVIEGLQAIMPFGRQADARDVAADAVGVLIGLIALRLLAGPRRVPT